MKITRTSHAIKECGTNPNRFYKILEELQIKRHCPPGGSGRKSGYYISLPDLKRLRQAIQAKRTPPANHVTFVQMAAQLQMSPTHLRLLHNMKTWPEGFEAVEVNNTYYFPEGIIEALRTITRPKAVPVRRPDTRTTEYTPPAPVQLPPVQAHVEEIPPRIIAQAAEPLDYYEMGAELIANGFKEAGLWVIKTKC